MTTRLEKAPTEGPVPLCLMLSDDEDWNIRMMFEHPPLLTGPRRHAPVRRKALASAASVAVAACVAVLLALRKSLA